MAFVIYLWFIWNRVRIFCDGSIVFPAELPHCFYIMHFKSFFIYCIYCGYKNRPTPTTCPSKDISNPVPRKKKRDENKARMSLPSRLHSKKYLDNIYLSIYLSIAGCRRGCGNGASQDFFTRATGMVYGYRWKDGWTDRGVDKPFTYKIDI